MTAGLALATERGHAPLRIDAKPSFANIILWKVIYETDEHYYVDAVRVMQEIKRYPGDRIKKLDIARDFSWLDVESQQAKDIERFRWFSNDYIAQDPNDPNRIVDMRYSFVPNQITALWGIELSYIAEREDHVFYSSKNNLTTSHREIFFNQLLGR